MTREATLESRTAQGPLWVGAALGLFAVVGITACVTAYHGSVAALILAGLVLLLSGILVFISGGVSCPQVVGSRCGSLTDFDPPMSFAGIALGALGTDMVGLGLIRYRWSKTRWSPAGKAAVR